MVRFLRIPGSVSDPDQIQKYRSTVSKAENGPLAELRLKGKTERTGWAGLGTPQACLSNF